MDKNATAMTVADRNAITGKKDKNGRTLASLSQSRLDLIDRQSLSDDEEMSENKPATATNEPVTVSKNAAVAIGEKMVCLTLTSEHLDHVVWRYETAMKQSVEKWKLVLDMLESDETPLADVIRAVKVERTNMKAGCYCCQRLRPSRVKGGYANPSSQEVHSRISE